MTNKKSHSISAASRRSVLGGLAATAGVLTAPQFLLFDELPGPRLSDRALASRLSYFLWSIENSIIGFVV